MKVRPQNIAYIKDIITHIKLPFNTLSGKNMGI